MICKMKVIAHSKLLKLRLAVKISEDFLFESRGLDRKKISEGDGTHAKVAWANMLSKSKSHGEQ
jgi:hypothetical protein